MSPFKFHRDLDIGLMQHRFGEDLFTAREVMGSFIEMADSELDLLEHARTHKKYPDFARVAGRMRDGLERLGLEEEKKRIDSLRSLIALEDSPEEFSGLASQLVEQIRDKSNLLKIEVQRLDQYLEQSAL